MWELTGQQRSPEVESARRAVGAERALVLEEFNDTGRELPVTTLVAPFEEQVRRTPDATALVFGTETLTYAEFNARANRLAHHLAALGVRPGTPVAVAVPRSLELLVTLVAVVKAGGAYLPLDPDYPADRLAYMLEHTGPACVVADTAGRVPVPHGHHRRRTRRGRGRRGRPPGHRSRAAGHARPPGIHHLHLGLHRPPQGCRRPALGDRQPAAVDAGGVPAHHAATGCCRRRRPGSTCPCGSSSGRCAKGRRSSSRSPAVTRTRRISRGRSANSP